MTTLIRLLAFVAILSSVSVAQTAKTLFFIERTLNANKLYYDAKLSAPGILDIKEPVQAYWIMWAKDPTGATREKMSLFEKSKAYGFDIKPDTVAKTFSMTLAAFPDRHIKVFMQNGKPKSQMQISGKQAFVNRIAINAKSGFIPKVNFIELFGTDVASGSPCYEKILPKK